VDRVIMALLIGKSFRSVIDGGTSETVQRINRDYDICRTKGLFPFYIDRIENRNRKFPVALLRAID